MTRHIRMKKFLFLLLTSGLFGFGIAADDEETLDGRDSTRPDHLPCGQQHPRELEEHGDDSSESRPLEVICETIDVSGEPAPPYETGRGCPAGSWPEGVGLGPVYRQPWSLLAAAPGVQTDHLPRDGPIAPPRFNTSGTDSDQNVLRVDGFEITEDSSGESSFELGLSSLERVEIASRGDSADVSTPGLRIDLTIPEGSNNPNVSGRFLTGDGADDRLRRTSVGELALGGALRRDRLWAWAAASDTESDHSALGGQTVASDLAHATGKLKFSAANTYLVAAWHRGSVREAGHGAGPHRTPDATWERDSDSQLWRLDIDHLPTDNLILSGSYGELDRRLDNLPLAPRNAGEGPLIISTDRLGVTSGTPFAQTGRSETNEWRLGGELFITSSKASHELELGVRQRRYSARDRWAAGNTRWLETATNFHFIAGGDSQDQEASYVVTSWLDSSGHTQLEQTAGWLQESLEFGRLTLVAGLHWDRQRGTSLVHSDIDPTAAESAMLDSRQAAAEWQSVLPRLGLTLQLDAAGRSLLRAGYGRFTSRLGPALTARLPRGFPNYDVDLLDSTESRARRAWGNRRPDLLASDLGPEITDELSLGLERQNRWQFVTGLTLAYRRTHDLLERRTLVRDANGAIRSAVAGDWYQAGSLSGLIPTSGKPSGAPYRASVYDLSPELELMPSGLWVNGDRRRESLSVSLAWRGRIARWQTRGHLSWNDSRWRLGPEFHTFDDPTDSFGSGDNDGARVIELVPRDRLGSTEVAVDSRWSFHWANSVELPWELRLGFALAGREGHPQPYFRRVVRQVAGIANVQLTQADNVRSPDIITLDTRLAKEITLGRYSLTLALEAFNLLGAKDVLRRELDLGVGRGGAVNETMTSRVWRLGVRLGWR